MRRRWERQREPEGHLDDWLMTYADMITLLLCFFAIFLSISLPHQQSPHRPEVVESASVPPPAAQPPAAQPREAAPQAIVPAVPPPPREAWHAPAEAPSEPPAPQKPLPVKTPAAPSPKSDLVSPALAEAPPPVPAPGAPRPRNLRFEREGDRITTLEMSSAAFFDSGSATLSGEGEAILREVVGDLKSDRFKDYRITVEGHTDDSPISTARYPSNWELSTARAAAVVHFFLDQGVPAPRLRAAGYADTFPKAPNRDAYGNAIAKNQTLNRRVVITLEKIDRSEP